MKNPSRSCSNVVGLALGIAVGLSIGPSADAQNPKLASAFGAHPGGGDDRQAIQDALNALQDGETLLFDEAGTYELRGSMGDSHLLQLEPPPGQPPLSNVTITAVPGVTIELTGFDRGATGARYPNVLNVSRCSSFTLKGAGSSSPLVFTTRAATIPPGVEGLPFLQGKVLSVNAQNRRALIEMTDSQLFLPQNCISKIWGAWEVKNGVPGYNDVYFTGTARAAGMPGGTPPTQKVELWFDPLPASQSYANWTTGNQVVVILNDSDTYAIWVYGCTGTTTFRDLRAHHLPGKFLQSGNNETCIVDNVDIQPANEGRFLSVARDGVNVDGTTLVVTNCQLSWCGDDGIVVNGTNYGQVDPLSVSVAGSQVTFQITPPLPVNPWPTWANPGQFLALLDGSSLSPGSVQFAPVVSMPTIVSGPGMPVQAPFATLEYTCSLTGASGGFLTMLGSPDALTWNPSYSTWSPPEQLGATVANCSVQNDRGVGITVRALNTTIFQCTARKASVCGIHAGGGMVDAYPWYAAGAPPHNLRIDSCIVDRCGGVHPIALTGSIEIALARGSTPGGSCSYWINPTYSTNTDVIQNVEITGNTITGNTVVSERRAGIFAANVSGGSITNNTFINCGSSEACSPLYGYAVALQTCGTWNLSGNSFTGCPGTVIQVP